MNTPRNTRGMVSSPLPVVLMAISVKPTLMSLITSASASNPRKSSTTLKAWRKVQRVVTVTPAGRSS